MTASTDIAHYTRIADAPHMINGQRMLARGARRIGGLALVLAALGLWFAPGASWEADTALFKLAVSVMLAFGGLGVLHAGRSVPAVEVEVDTLRREVRLVRGKGRARSLVSRTRMADLGPAEVRGTMVRLWGPDGVLLVELAMTDPTGRYHLISALRDAGKL